MDITAAAIATLISSLISSIVALTVSKHNAIRNLNDQLDNILKIAIQYPYLESPHFTNTWTSDSIEEHHLRYENYCILVFNYLEKLCKHYKYDTKKIEEHLNVEEWVLIHQVYWLSCGENQNGYSQKLKIIIKNYLNQNEKTSINNLLR